MTKAAKALIRQTAGERRNQLSLNDIKDRSTRIVQRIQQDTWYQQARTVGLYYPIGSEVDLLELLKDRKQFCFPKITDFSKTEMEFVRHTGRYLEGRFSLKEPDGDICPKEAIDLILVPGIAFAKDGQRLGYGKGFFDRYLWDFPNKTIGIGYSFQLHDRLPIDPWDKPLMRILTDQEDICIQP